MKERSPSRYAFCILFVVAVLFVSDAKADDWIRVRSTNFSLVGNASEKDMRRVANKLEQFREVFRTLFPNLKFSSSIPTTVIVFKNERSFRPFKPVNADGKATDWVAGYFQAGEDVNYITLSTSGPAEQTYRTIFHEYVHFLVNNSFGRSRIPPWFNEGIAEYYELFTIEDDQKVKLGNLNDNHLATLQRTQLLPFETFFNVDYYSLHRQGGHGANIFYAQSWAFMHYLLHGKKGAYRDGLPRFANAVVNGEKPAEAFTKAFAIDFATMEKELKRYVEQRSFVGTLVTLSGKLTFESSLTVEPLPEPEAQTYLGDLLVHTNRHAEAEKLLAGIEKDASGSSFFNTTMGMAKVRQNKYDEATAYLEKAIAGDNNNHLGHYYYAFGLSLRAQGPGGFVQSYSDDLTQKMRTSLKRAIAIDPGFPESYYLLSFISMVRGDEIDESLKLMETALAMSPGNERYILTMAGLYVRKEDIDRGAAMARAVANSAADPGIRQMAQNVLNNAEQLRQYKEQIEKYRQAQNRQDIPSQAGSDTPMENGLPVLKDRMIIVDRELTEEEIEELRRKAQLESIYESLRKPEAGEVRVLGSIQKITCDNTVLYRVAVEGKEILLTSKDFQQLHLMTFIGPIQGDVGCGFSSPDALSIITYRPFDKPQKKAIGEMMSIEFVEKGFALPADQP